MHNDHTEILKEISHSQENVITRIKIFPFPVKLFPAKPEIVFAIAKFRNYELTFEPPGNSTTAPLTNFLKKSTPSYKFPNKCYSNNSKSFISERVIP